MKSKAIAITGGIGSGKSEVIKYLQSLGYATIDCDLLAKEVASRPQTVEQVRQLLGDEYIVYGQLNRMAIRDKIFADEILLQKYNKIFFDEIKSLLDERIAEIDNQKKVFVEISVFDAFDYAWDEIWFVEADEEIRVNRTVARDKSSRASVQSVMNRQHICSAYTLKLNNVSTLDDLKRQVNNALRAIGC